MVRDGLQVDNGVYRLIKDCLHCDRQVEFIPRRQGWTHVGGRRYVVRCLECDHLFPEEVVCPRCGSPKQADHHPAMPRQSK